MTSVDLEGDIDQAIALIRDRIVPQASRLEGIVAAYWLGNRNTRRGLAVTVWESEEAMLARTSHGEQRGENGRRRKWTRLQWSTTRL
ncbi:MAG TPA: hypothetical protein VF058_06110 [Actinomycetota bacterium]